MTVDRPVVATTMIVGKTFGRMWTKRRDTCDAPIACAARTYSRERPRRGAWEVLELRYANDDPRVAAVDLVLLQCLNHTAGRTTTVYFDDASFALASP